MGVVWRARDARLERPVAVKLLSLPPGTAGAERERLLAMFGREARAAAALDSSYIVPVFDHGADGEVPYLVMPLLSGRTVGELLADGPLPPERVAELSAQVCRALATAHRAGIVHRDIKPANVMLTDEGTVKVLDFGIAKFLDAATGGRLTATTDSPIGTLPYMAPERFTRGADDGRTDVYALGCTVYEMLTGAPPFDSTSAPALMHSHVYETPEKPSLRRPGLAPEWDELVGRMLAKPVEDRPTAEEAREAFERLALPAPRVPASAQLADRTPPLWDRTPPPPHRGARTTSRPSRSTPHPTQPHGNSRRAPQPSAPTPPRTCSRRRSRSSRPLPRPLDCVGGASPGSRPPRPSPRSWSYSPSSSPSAATTATREAGRAAPAGRRPPPARWPRWRRPRPSRSAPTPMPRAPPRRCGAPPRAARSRSSSRAVSPPSTRATCGPGPTG
ncbi:serine/threonine-protein kinase [Streptomyces sp. GTA36]